MKIYYLGYVIFNTSKNVYIVAEDNSEHTSLLSARVWIDYLTK